MRQEHPYLAERCSSDRCVSALSYATARLKPSACSLNRTAASLRFNRRPIALAAFLPANCRSFFVSLAVQRVTVLFLGTFDSSADEMTPRDSKRWRRNRHVRDVADAACPAKQVTASASRIYRAAGKGIHPWIIVLYKMTGLSAGD